jgi:hypothetical protein
VIHGEGGYGPNSDICSVLETQSLPEFNGATFQAASNFNCLEFCGPGQSAADGVTCYVYDTTQGPYCAIGAGAATVYRNYFVPHDGTIGQLENEIELLGKTPIAPYVKHGYPRLSASTLETLAQQDWTDLNQFYVGLHENCEVTTTAVQGSGRITEAVPEGQIVHHVYAAAFNFSGSVEKNQTSLSIGKQLLSAEYQATVLAAWEMSLKYPGREGSRRLVLTALGGGVFGNPRSLIIEAVASSLELIQKSGLDVYFVCYDSYNFQESVAAGLKELVDKTGGRVISSRDEL